MMEAAIRDWIKYNKSKKLFDACKYKGTFVNCKSEACIECQRDKTK